jgi:hypothetical protein
LRRSYPQLAAGPLQLGQASYDRTNRGAIDVRYARHIKNHSRLVRRDYLIHFQLQPRTFRPRVNAAFHLQCGYAWFHRSF